jgi:DNA-binding transcriptional MerR regulator
VTATDVAPDLAPAAAATPGAPALGAGAAGPDRCKGPEAIAAELIARSAPTAGREAPCLSIAEVAELTGVTAHTLRYYERIGLVDVPRDDAGHRAYGQAEVGRVVFITRLRMTAMPIRQIQAYFRLVAQGEGTEAERLDLLERHRADVMARLDDLRSALAVIDFKIALYGGTPGAPAG